MREQRAVRSERGARRGNRSAAGRVLRIACAALVLFAPSLYASTPRYRHVVVVIEENHGFAQIIGRNDAPYINALARHGVLFTDAHGVTHPSQPNYLALFSGSTQGVTSDRVPAAGAPFTTPNLAERLHRAGCRFAIYSEDLPAPGSTAASAPERGRPWVTGYVRKHNPYVNWQAAGNGARRPNSVPAAGNLPMRDFPSDFARLPAVSFVIPDLRHDMHGTGWPARSDAKRVRAGDDWLRERLGRYVAWARHHDSLLILTFDEDDFTAQNHIPVVFAGAHLRRGEYHARIDHYTVLATIESVFGLRPLGTATDPVPTVFRPAPGGRGARPRCP